MKTSLHRVELIVCNLPLLRSCNKTKITAVSATDAAADDEGVTCVVTDAPPRTLSDAIAPDAIVQTMTLVAD